MPKSQIVDPAEVRRSGVLEIDPIPLNQYRSDFKRDRKSVV